MYKRVDRNGNVIGLSKVPEADYEPCELSETAVRAFLYDINRDEAVRHLETLDREMARVIEDLVQLLVDRNIITFTDLPESAQDKMLLRRRLRANITGGLIGDSDDDVLPP